MPVVCVGEERNGKTPPGGVIPVARPERVHGLAGARVREAASRDQVVFSRGGTEPSDALFSRDIFT